MFANWKPKLVAIGGFIAFVTGLLGFFEVTWTELRQFMTTHYLWLIGVLVSFTIFVWGCYKWWKSARVTPENVRSKTRQWLDGFRIEHAVTPPFSDWNWGYRVFLQNGPLLFIAHTKGRPDSILFRGSILPLTPEQRVTYNKLSESEKDQLYYQLRLETARARFFFNNDANLNEVTFDSWIQIRTLTTSTFIDSINQVYFSAIIVWSTISLELGGIPPPTQPSSTPDMEASPPSPT